MPTLQRLESTRCIRPNIHKHIGLIPPSTMSPITLPHPDKHRDFIVYFGPPMSPSLQEQRLTAFLDRVPHSDNWEINLVPNEEGNRTAWFTPRCLPEYYEVQYFIENMSATKVLPFSRYFLPEMKCLQSSDSQPIRKKQKKMTPTKLSPHHLDKSSNAISSTPNKLVKSSNAITSKSTPSPPSPQHTIDTPPPPFFIPQGRKVADKYAKQSNADMKMKAAIAVLESTIHVETSTSIFPTT